MCIISARDVKMFSAKLLFWVLDFTSQGIQTGGVEITSLKAWKLSLNTYKCTVACTSSCWPLCDVCLLHVCRMYVKACLLLAFVVPVFLFSTGRIHRAGARACCPPLRKEVGGLCPSSVAYLPSHYTDLLPMGEGHVPGAGTRASPDMRDGRAGA